MATAIPLPVKGAPPPVPSYFSEQPVVIPPPPRPRRQPRTMLPPKPAGQLQVPESGFGSGFEDGFADAMAEFHSNHADMLYVRPFRARLRRRFYKLWAIVYGYLP